MREERGQFAGNMIITDAVDLWGNVAGDVIVREGGKLYLRGAIYGNLKVENGGRVHVFGNVGRNLTVAEGAKVIHSGVVSGDVINRGGRIYIDLKSKVFGKVKTKSGETQYEKPAKWSES